MVVIMMPSKRKMTLRSTLHMLSRLLVLEIGCGAGRVTIPLATNGVDITGLDVSSSMLAEAKRMAQQQSLLTGERGAPYL